MIITYNGVQNLTNAITFDGIPNILTIEETNSGGTNATLTITLNNGSIDTSISYYIEINGYTISSTNELSKAKGRFFYLPNTITATNRNAVATTLSNALRSVYNVSANYDVYIEMNNTQMTSNIIVKAKNKGSRNNITYNSNISLFSVSNIYGSSTDVMMNSTNSKIFVDVYSNDKYITTLEKNYYNNRCDFDLSPLLGTLSEYNSTVPYKMNVYAMSDSIVSIIATFDNNYITKGYYTNQQQEYILLNGYHLAQNVYRGTSKGFVNNTTLYTASNIIPLSLYKDNSASSSLNITLKYMDSRNETISSSTTTINQSEMFKTHDIVFDTTSYNNNQTTYLGIEIPNIGNIIYKIIRPLNYSNSIQRIYFNNSMGGVSFFDFSGKRTENHTTNVETYESSLFNYYKQDTKEITKVYGKDTEISVSLKSHLIDKDARWLFNDMLNSTNAWTEINGETYSIIINAVNVDETTQDDVYEATITYTYSLKETFI